MPLLVSVDVGVYFRDPLSVHDSLRNTRSHQRTQRLRSSWPNATSQRHEKMQVKIKMNVNLFLHVRASVLAFRKDIESIVNSEYSKYVLGCQSKVTKTCVGASQDDLRSILLSGCKIV